MLAMQPAQIHELDEFIKSFDDSALSRYYFSSEDRIRKTFLEFHEKKTILTASHENRIIGFLCHIPNGAFHAFCFLHLLTVIPEYRGHGFGKQILKIFEEKHANATSRIFLVVADFNPKAKTFYEKAGYMQVGDIPDLYRADVHEYLMMKVLHEDSGLYLTNLH